jgi:hypothetical protein
VRILSDLHPDLAAWVRHDRRKDAREHSASTGLIMSWFKVRDGQVVYSGAISRGPYSAWRSTKAGAQAIDAAASRAGLRLFGPARAGRRVWREIRDAAQSADGCAALQAAADLYLRTMSNLAYASGLPRTTVGLRRLVLVPRTLASGRARALITARLSECQAFAQRPVAERDFLFEAVLVQADAAVRAATPTIRRPIRAADGWTCIGADTGFVWVDQYWSGPGWSGHWFMYEHPREPLSRSDRKAVERDADALQGTLATLSRERRHAVVQLAASTT